jgi:signal transduction histidine kinase
MLRNRLLNLTIWEVLVEGNEALSPQEPPFLTLPGLKSFREGSSTDAAKASDIDYVSGAGLEQLLTTLADTFTDTHTENLGRSLRFALQCLVEFLGVERGCLAEFAADGKLTPSYAYGVPEFPAFPPQLLEDRHVWHREQLHQGKVLLLTCLPSEGRPTSLVSSGLTILPGDISHLLFPLRIGGHLLGALVLGSYRRLGPWPPRLVQASPRLNEIFGHALHRQQTEQKQQRLRDQLAHMSRVALLGELAGAVAHEVNQPLCAIVSNAQAAQRLLAGNPADLNEVGEALKDIAADGRRASDVIARIRLLLRQGPSARGPVDMNQTIRETVTLVHRSLEKNQIALSLQLAESLPPVQGDPVHLQQVLLNLILNAMDALLQKAEEARFLEVYSLRQRDNVEVVVRDSGRGLAPELLERVFEAFYTTKPTGMGIGLSICRTILEASGGRIWAAPASGGGAAFHFTLPTCQGAQP